MFTQRLRLSEPRPRGRPFLVVLETGDGKELLHYARMERELYSRIVGFNANENLYMNGADIFWGPPRFTQCRHIPWVIYSNRSYKDALRAVRLHGHPKSRVHRATLAFAPPKMLWVTRNTYNLRSRKGIKK